jgi:uncharacterized protein (TIGR03437 family)
MKKALLYSLLWLPLAILPPARAQVQLNPAPTRIVGQDNMTQTAANLVEGREFNTPLGIAVDTTQNPPALYVADTGNNRVLGFRNALSFTNGQKADIVIGQTDFLSTAPQGPFTGGVRNTGLASPTGLAVDQAGNLYVVDSGNNRILRFPTPFKQANLFPDLAIGQTSFNTNGPNNNGISATTLSLNNANGTFQAYITFDAAGNLFVGDAGNNRVLGFSAADLAANPPVSGPSAYVVLGQLDFASGGFNNNTAATSLNAINAPTGVAFDQAGNLYVSESSRSARSRVVIYSPPFTVGKTAARLIGVVPATVVPQPLAISEQQLAPSAGGVFIVNNSLGVVDSGFNRLLVYNPLSQFTSNVLTQQAQIVFGQPNFSVAQPNQNLPEPSAVTLQGPAAVAVTGTQLFIVDSGNNRVIAVPYSANAIGSATGVLGQDAFNFNAPNLAEGREFRFISGGNAPDAGIATDLTSAIPHLWVADTYNNRVLGFRDLRTVKAGAKADIVIGQPDFQHTEANYPFNDPNRPTANNLRAPTGLIVDSAGNLFVADTGNGRVVRFPNPFATGQNFPAADLVLGQATATSAPIRDASAATMAAPYGLALATNNGLLVADINLNRVLFFAGAPSTFTTGMAASKVFGQPNFTSTGSGTDLNRFSAPHHIATDTDDRLYVADSSNNRVLIFDRAPLAGTDPRAATLISGLNVPRGIYVSASTGAIWVANASGNNIQQYPNFNTLIVSSAGSGSFTPTATISDGLPLAVTLDAFGDLYTADGSNRVQINFPGLTTLNAANFNPAQPLAPGEIASIFGFANQFGAVTQAANAPLPTQLANVEVLFNGAPAPLYYIGPNQINFVIPNGAPTTGTADLLVMRADTGQILGNFPVQMNIAAPALFTIGTIPGQGQVAAINQDGTINGPKNPAANGSVVSFYGTGEGFVPGAPPDGVAATGAISSPQHINVIVGLQGFAPDEDVLYSGLAPGLPGVWQVNVRIPANVAPTTSTGNVTPVVFLVSSIPSNGQPPNRVLTTMWVAPPK